MRLRELEKLAKSTFVSEDETMEKLPKEIVETVVIWLSNNQELWTKTVETSQIRHCSCFEQVWNFVVFFWFIRIILHFSKDAAELIFAIFWRFSLQSIVSVGTLTIIS